MRLLANENIPVESIRRLREEGHDVLSAAETLLGSRDEEVLSLAAREARILLTFDRDYGELIYRRGMAAPLAVVYLRFVPSRPSEPAEVVMELEKVVALANRYTVVELTQIRQRPLP
jgi:predicted nuclease of predicted toxin-antitoxin system